MFWENLCKLCTQAGILPTNLVSTLDISRGSVTHWKQGKIPHYQTQKKIADYFGISVDELLGSDTEKKESTAFWENLCELCARAGIKPTNLASAVGISCGAVTHWKQGKIPHYQTQKKIADYFGISVDELLGEDIKKEDPVPPSYDYSKARFLESVNSLSASELKELENYLNYILSKRKK